MSALTLFLAAAAGVFATIAYAFCAAKVRRVRARLRRIARTRITVTTAPRTIKRKKGARR